MPRPKGSKNKPKIANATPAPVAAPTTASHTLTCEEKTCNSIDVKVYGAKLYPSGEVTKVILCEPHKISWFS